MKKEKKHNKENQMANLDVVTDLYEHDLAARDVYKQVIESLSAEDQKVTLQEFLEDYEHHISELSSLIEEGSGKRPSETKTMKGTLLSGYSTVRSMISEHGALKALKMAEEIVYKRYQDASSQSLPDDQMAIINKNYDDEKKHMKYLNQLNL